MERDFLKNTKNFLNIEHIRKTSSEAIVDLKSRDISPDFLYIDGCHKYDSVLLDIDNYLPLFKNPGYVGFHDYDNEEVRRAITERLLEANKIYQDNSVLYKI